MNSTNLYDLLGVDKNASISEIKKAYRKRVARLHPDHSHSNSYDEFVEVAKAYEILSDPDKRKKYDEEGFTGDTIQDSKQVAYEVIKNWFRGILTRAIESKEIVDIIGELHKLNKAFYNRSQGSIKKAQKDKKQLSKIRKRLKRKKPANYCLLQNEIEKQVISLDVSIAQSFRDLEIIKIINNILDEYEFDIEEIVGEDNNA